MANGIKKRVLLIVEDDLSLMRAIKHKLEKNGFETLIANSAEDALLILEKNKNVDMIWLDLLMPGIGGVKFLEIIRKNEIYKNIPVIVVSVSGGPETIKKVSDYNIFEYVMKDQCNLADIVKRIKNHLNKPN